MNFPLHIWIVFFFHILLHNHDLTFFFPEYSKYAQRRSSMQVYEKAVVLKVLRAVLFKHKQCLFLLHFDSVKILTKGKFLLLILLFYSWAVVVVVVW